MFHTDKYEVLFLVLTAVTMNTAVFGDMTRFSLSLSELNVEKDGGGGGDDDDDDNTYIFVI
jgi:hypothetical protein